MIVLVYFEGPSSYSELVAKFDREETYIACLGALMSLAESKGYFVTEVLSEDEL